MDRSDVRKMFLRTRIKAFKDSMKKQGYNVGCTEWFTSLRRKQEELAAWFDGIAADSLEYKSLASECYKATIASEKKRKKVNVENIPVILGVCKTNNDTFAWISAQRKKHCRSQAPCEVRVDGYLRFKGVDFVSEKPFIVDGKIYFADFYIQDKNLIIEVDGETHDAKNDSLRDAAFARYGIRTIRVSNRLAKDPDNLATVLQSYGI